MKVPPEEIGILIPNRPASVVSSQLTESTNILEIMLTLGHVPSGWVLQSHLGAT